MKMYDKLQTLIYSVDSRDRQMHCVSWQCSDVLSFSDATGNRAADAS